MCFFHVWLWWAPHDQVPLYYHSLHSLCCILLKKKSRDEQSGRLFSTFMSLLWTRDKNHWSSFSISWKDIQSRGRQSESDCEDPDKVIISTPDWTTREFETWRGRERLVILLQVNECLHFPVSRASNAVHVLPFTSCPLHPPLLLRLSLSSSSFTDRDPGVPSSGFTRLAWQFSLCINRDATNVYTVCNMTSPDVFGLSLKGKVLDSCIQSPVPAVFLPLKASPEYSSLSLSPGIVSNIPWESLSLSQKPEATKQRMRRKIQALLSSKRMDFSWRQQERKRGWEKNWTERNFLRRTRGKKRM